MNKIYRQVWSAARGCYVVAAETAKGRGKASSTTGSIAAVGAFLFGFPGMMLAQTAVVAPGSGNTQVYAAGNGATVVNINTANAAGLSHNKYSTYNVDAKGLVLNNGDTSAAQRQSVLAGQIAGNINLGAQAKVILNEVVSTNRSTLAGFTEVLGGRADVIVANPNGITCSGCGFLNTDRATLTTGTPNFAADGGLAGFAVNRGDILINGAGLDASGQQTLDLVTRSVKFDGQINGAAGGMLRVTTGLNQWRYADGAVTGSTSAADAAPAYAIDSSSLGGMYVGRITLTATEAGVGVRMLGEAASNGGDFTLSSAGKIEIKSAIAAAGNASIATSSASGADDLLINGSGAVVSANGGRLDLSSAGQTRLANGKLFASADLSVTSASLLDAGSAVDTRDAKGTTTVTTTGAADINGTQWSANGALKGQFGSLAVGAGGAKIFSSAATTELSASGTLALGTASISSASDMTLTAGAGAVSTSAAGVIEAKAGNLALNAGGGLDNAGSITAALGAVTARVDGALNNSGSLKARTTLDIADRNGGGGENMVNTGTLQADGSMTLRAAAIGNQAGGTMQAAGGTTLNATSLTNGGTFTASTVAGQSSTLSAASIVNNGTLQSAGDLALAASSSLSNTSTIKSDNNLSITGSGASFDTQSGAIDGKDVSITVASLNNSGTLQSGASMTLAIGNALTNSGTVRSGTTMSSSSASLANNNGTFQATQGGTIAVTGTLDNTGNLYASDTAGYDATVSAATLTNSGLLQSRGAATLNIATALDNSNDLLATGALVVRGTDSAYTVNNSKTMQSGGLLDIKGQGGGNGVAITVGATGVTHGDSVDVNAASLTVNGGGALHSDAGMTLAVANALTNNGTVRSGTVLNSSSASLTNGGTLQATQGGTISVTGALVNTANLYVSDTAGYHGTVNAATLTNSGTLQSRGNATLNIATSLDNSSQILTDGSLTVRGTDSAYTVGNTKLIQSKGLLDIKGLGNGNGVDITVGSTGTLDGNSMSVNAGAVTVNDGGMISSYGAMDLTATSLTFAGQNSRIVAASGGSGNATVAVATAFNNLGAVHSGQNMTFSAPSITNSADGAFSALDTLTLQASAGNLTNNGALYAGSNLVASASGAFTNNSTIDSDNAMSLSAANFKNNAQINAKGNLTISAATFDNGTPDDVSKVTSADIYTHGKALDTTVPFDDTKYTPDSSNEWYWCWADRCTTRYYSNAYYTVESFVHGAPTHIPQIISGGTLSIKNFTNANNTGGLLSGATKVDLQGTNFTMTPLELLTKTYTRSWETFSHWVAQGPAMYEDKTIKNDTGNVAGPITSAPVAGAGIYGAAITGSIGGLTISGSGYGAGTTPQGAAGAAGATLSAGAAGAGMTMLATGAAATTVNGQPAIQFTYVTITLPTSPNGYFIQTKNSSAKYLIETNPLFNVGSTYNGSEYLQSQLTGYNASAMLKHLGDAGYEAYLIRQQLIAETGRNILVAGKNEDDQLRALFANAASEMAAASLTYGAALSQSQQDALTRDIVWMVTARISGQDVLVPVVYLSKATRSEIKGGAVIAGNTIDLTIATKLSNTGGTLSAKETLKITATGDIDNISGRIEGGEVTLKSTTGSINNTTLSQAGWGVKMVLDLDSNGKPVPELDQNGVAKKDDKGNIVYRKKPEQAVDGKYSTQIGMEAGISSTGKLTLDAAKDIKVTGAQVSAGAGATLKAGGDISFDSIENKNTEIANTGWKRETIKTTTVKQVGSGLTVNGGDLELTAGNNIVLSATKVDVKNGDATLTATAGEIKVLSKQDSVTQHTESVVEGLGVGGAVWGRETTVIDEFTGTNVASTINVGGGGAKGNLTLSALNKDITIQGSNITASGDGTMLAKNVNVLEGHDEYTKNKTVTTDAFMVIGAAQNVNAADRIDVSREYKDVTAEDKKRMFLGDINRPTEYNADGSVKKYGNEGDLKNNPGYDGSIYGQFDQVGASTVGHRKGNKTYDELSGQTDHVEAPGLTLYQNTVQTDIEKRKTSVAGKLSFGKNLTVKGADSIKLAGTDVKATGNIVLESKAVDILARTSSSETTSSTNVTQIGLYASADAAGKVGASTEYMTQDQIMGSAMGAEVSGNASGSATGAAKGFGKGTANGGIDVLRNNKDSTTTTRTTTTGSSLSGMNVTITGAGGAKAEKLVLEGANVEAKNDVTLKAEQTDILAAGEKTVVEKNTERHRVGLNINVTADAEVSGKGSASGDASATVVGGTAGVSAEAGGSLKVNLEARVELARGRVLNETKTDTTVAGSNIKAGNQLKIEAGTLKVTGSQLSGDNSVDIKANDMQFSAAEEIHDTTSSSTKYSFGRYAEVNLGVDVSASASARVSGQAIGRSQQGGEPPINKDGTAGKSGMVNDALGNVGVAEATGSVALSAEVNARASTGYYGSGTQLNKTTTDHKAIVSSITSKSGSISRTGTGDASKIADTGTRIEATGDFTQSADTISSMAAADKKESSLDEVNLSVKVGAYASLLGKTRIDADASADRNQSYRMDYATRTDAATGDTAPSGYARVDTFNDPAKPPLLPGLASKPSRANPFPEQPNANIKGTVAIGAEMGMELNNESNKYGYQTAVVSTIKAGKISSTSKAATVMEGTKLNSSGEGIDISAGSLDMKAAVNTETGTKTTNAVAAKMWAGAALGTSGAKDFGLTGNFDRVADTDSRTKEIAGEIAASGGGSVKITTTSGDARFVGTRIAADGNTTLDIKGKLDVLAAKDERTKGNDTAKVAANITENQAACQGPQAQSRSCSGLTVGYAKEDMATATYTGASIGSGGALTINAGGAAVLESTKLQAGGGIAIDGKDSVQFTNAADTRSTTRASMDIQLNSMNGQNWNTTQTPKKNETTGKMELTALPADTSMDKENSKKWGGVKAGFSQDVRSEAVVGSIDATGGNISITSKNDLRFEGTKLDAAKGAITVTATDGSVNFDVAKNSRIAFGVDGSVGASTNTIDSTTNKPDGSQPATRLDREGRSAAGKFNVTMTTVEAGSTVKADGGVTVVSKGDLTLKGTKVESVNGDISVKSTEGNIAATTAQSSTLSLSVDASVVNYDTITGEKSAAKTQSAGPPTTGTQQAFKDAGLGVPNTQRAFSAVVGALPSKMGNILKQMPDPVGAPPSPYRQDFATEKNADGSNKPKNVEGNPDTRGAGGNYAVGGSIEYRKTFEGASFTAKNGSLTIDSAGAQGSTTLTNVTKDVKTENIEKAGGLEVKKENDIGIALGAKTTGNTHDTKYKAPAATPPEPEIRVVEPPPPRPARPPQPARNDGPPPNAYYGTSPNAPGIAAYVPPGRTPPPAASSSLQSGSGTLPRRQEGTYSPPAMTSSAVQKGSESPRMGGPGQPAVSSSQNRTYSPQPIERSAPQTGSLPKRTGGPATKPGTVPRPAKANVPPPMEKQISMERSPQPPRPANVPIEMKTEPMPGLSGNTAGRPAQPPRLMQQHEPEEKANTPPPPTRKAAATDTSSNE